MIKVKMECFTRGEAVLLGDVSGTRVTPTLIPRRKQRLAIHPKPRMVFKRAGRG